MYGMTVSMKYPQKYFPADIYGFTVKITIYVGIEERERERERELISCIKL